MLVVTVPESFVAVVVQEPVGALPVLVVVKPLAFISLTVGKDIGSRALALTFHVFPLIPIAVLPCCLAFPIGFSLSHLPVIIASVVGGAGAQIDALSIGHTGQEEKAYTE